MKTKNQIKDIFQVFADNHLQIHSFGYGQEFEQQAIENEVYPLMWVLPTTATLNGGEFGRTYRIAIADRVFKGEFNEIEVESDTELMILDLVAYMERYGEINRINISTNKVLTPFWEKFNDEVTGHYLDITIVDFFDSDSCSIPMEGITPAPPILPCANAVLNVNGALFTNIASGSTFPLFVKNISGVQVGSKVGSEWIVPDSENATYEILDIDLNVLYSGSIVSGGNLSQTIFNSTFDVLDSNLNIINTASILAQGFGFYNVANSSIDINKSDGSLIELRSILATENDSYNVADSNVANFDDSYSVGVKATENLILPDSNIRVNAASQGNVVSVKTIDVNLTDGVIPVIPSSSVLVGNTLTITLPPVKDIFIKGIFEIAVDTMPSLTIDSDTAGTYVSTTNDGSSGSITFSKNGAAFAAFSNPLTLVASDTLVVKRVITTGLGFYKITGTYV